MTEKMRSDEEKNHNLSFFVHLLSPTSTNNILCRFHRDIYVK